MTTLPERLRASAQEMRSLHPYNEYQTVKMLDIADSARIARELEEAAQALEGADGVATDQPTEGKKP